MQKSQKGFTLIELIVVIVLLGILGVTALGKFQNLASDAEQAALNGIAAELSGASSINYAKSLLNTPELGIGVGASGGTNNIDTSSDGCLETGLANLMTGGAIPDIGSTAVTLTAATALCTNPGDIYSCTLNAGTQTATATIICTE